VVYSSALRKQGQYAEADQILTNSSSEWKKNTSIIMESALVKYGLNKGDEAVKLLTPILIPNDQLREKYIYLSNSLLDMAKFKTSDEYFAKAMSIFPSSLPYYNRACTLVRKGEKDRAFLALNKAVEHGGYNVRKDYETDPDLLSLKSDRRWDDLMKRLK
jgi:tetratricopeptide (TPR) repeat protein